MFETTGVERTTDGPCLADRDPDAKLAADLAATDLHSLDDYELVEVVAAWERMASWVTAHSIEAMAELAGRPVFGGAEAPDRDRLDARRLAGLEVAARLRLAPTTGHSRVVAACELVDLLPETVAAMRAGRIDYRRAQVLADLVRPLTADQARAVQAQVLPKAGDRTLGQHRAAVARAVLAVDPADAERRHAEAAAERTVQFSPERDGMASIWALLPADDAAALRAALDAGAAGMKADAPADPRTIDQRRADALTEMAPPRPRLRPARR